jgi:hypothetical protein
MPTKDLKFAMESQEEKAIVLLIFDDKNEIVKDLAIFLAEQNLEPILVPLTDLKQINEKFKDKKEQIYKIIFVYGFNLTSKAAYQSVFSFLKDFADQEIPLILLSSVLKPLEILDNLNPEYQLFLDSKNNFLEEFLDNFPQALAFLAEDLLLDQEQVNYPLKLFFTALAKGYLLDPEVNCYWQSKSSYLELVKKEILKPHSPNQFLIRGKKEFSSQSIDKIKNLYRQYYQEDLKVIKIISSLKKSALLDVFKKVSFSKISKNQADQAKTVDFLIDQKIRVLPKIKADLDLILPAATEIQKAIEAEAQTTPPKPSKVLKESPTLINEQLSSQKSKTPKTEAKDTETSKEEALSKTAEQKPEKELDQQISSIFDESRIQEKDKRISKKVKKTKSIVRKRKKRTMLFYGGMLSFSLALILIILYSSFNFSKNRVANLIFKQVESRASLGSQNAWDEITDSFFFKFFSKQYHFYENKLDENMLGDAKDIIDLESVLTDLSIKNTVFSNKIFGLYEKTLNREEGIAADYQESKNSLQEKSEAEANLLSYLNSLNTSLFSKSEENVWEDFISETEKSVKNSLTKQRFMISFTDFINSSSRKTILILTQDNNQIRSTGGVLDQAVLLTFKDSYLLDKQIIDISDISQEVYGQKEAYPNQAALLKTEQLTLENSNWQADFALANQDITWFIEQSRDISVDLTIILNSKSLEKIVDAGVFEYQNDLNKFFKLDQEKLVQILGILFTDLNNKEVFMQSKDDNLQEAILANVWSGEILETACPSEFQQGNCFLDYIYQVENAVSANKISKNISEKIEHNLGVGQEFIRHKRKITFKNSSKKSSSVSNYEDYLQLFLPKEAQIEKVLLNGNIVPASFYEETLDEKHKIFAVLLDIPSGEEYQFEITYLIKNKMTSPFSYVFLNQKQAGLENKKTNYNIVFDEVFKPQVIAPRANYENQIISFSEENQNNFLFAVSFE